MRGFIVLNCISCFDECVKYFLLWLAMVGSFDFFPICLMEMYGK
jgi:hypothetical protein